MSDVAALRRENEALERRVAELLERALDAEQALEAFARGEIDAVTVEASVTPVLLRGAQAELRRSEQLFRAVFDGSIDAMLLEDDAGRYLDANPAACALFGVPRAELIGRASSEFEAPEFDGAAAERELEMRGQLRGHFPFVCADGSRRTLDVSAVANVLPGVNLSILRDVSEAEGLACSRELLVASLEREKRRLGNLFEKAPAFVATLRGDHHVFELVNDAYRALTGGDEPLGKSVRDAHPELHGRGFVEQLDDVLATGVPFTANGMPIMVTRHAGAAPEQRYLNFVYQPIVEADGSRSGVFIHGVDVTDATVAQQRVRAQFRGIPVPTYIWQRVERAGMVEFVLVDFNEAALTISGDGLEHAIGESASMFFADVPEVIDVLARCLEERETIHLELDRTARAPLGQRRFAVTYAPAPPDLVIVNMADVTDRIKVEQSLRQSQKMEAVGRLAGGIAHDFNNLLSVILSYTSFALDALPQGDLMRDDLVEIEKAGRRATELTGQLLAFSRQQLLQPRVICLGDIAVRMESMLGRLLGADIDLRVLRAPGVGRVLADPGQIEQVLMNLVVNARDAMPRGGRLTIEITNVELHATDAGSPLGVVDGEYVMLAVSDTGVGMDAATRASVFEPFFTTKETGRGTGLGLATVFGIVKQSGGAMNVSSEPGVGSTFKVYLPRTHRDTETNVESRHREMQKGSETIFVVEDEPQVRAVICAILRRSSYHVIEAANGRDAIAIAGRFEGSIDLLLTDVVMPHVNGRKLAEALALERPEMKVLFASGYTDDAVILHGILDAGVSFIQKPFTPDTLLRKVREVLGMGAG